MNAGVVISAYNEEKSIGKVIKSLHKEGYKNIIVVDDGSTDRTARLSKRMGCVVISHKKNMGPGAALSTGLKYCVKKRIKYIVTMDADGQHRSKDIPKLLAPLKEYDIVFGSRFLDNKTKMPFHRRILLKGSTIVIWLFYGIKMTDAHIGFRALTLKAAKKIKIKRHGFEFCSEIVNEIKKKKLKWKEVPVKVIYKGIRKGHASYLAAIKILLKMLEMKFDELRR